MKNEKKKILVIRHVKIEGPGTFGDFLEKKKIGFVFLDAFKKNGAQLRRLDLSKISGVVILGGPMNVYEEKKYPFLKAEKYLIRELIIHKIPLIGICLGAQLIACALGARVRRSSKKEIGWYEASLKPAAQEDPLLGKLKDSIPVFQWHEDTFDLPAHAVLLATGGSMNQAFRFRENTWGFQFHLEVDQPMIDSWCGEKSIEGPGASRLKEFKSSAQAVYDGFLSCLTAKNRLSASLKRC